MSEPAPIGGIRETIRDLPSGDFREKSEPPIALCCCGTPLVSTFEVRKTEWYCVTCKKFYEWMHARRGSGENPSEELQKRLDEAQRQYDTERAERLKSER